MAKIHKIKSNGDTIYPATIPQAVVNPDTQVPLNVALDNVDGRLSDAEETISAIVGTDYLHYSYGIEIDDSIADPAKTRIGNLSLHAQLPIQSRMRKCLLLDNGKVNYYLNANNSNLKEDGTAANLDGTDGMVMVEIPKHYRKFETEGTLFRVYISEMPISGFHIVPLMYISAYEASIDRTNASLPKLASVVNYSAAFRGGSNTASWDGTYRTLLGRPGTNTSLTNFRAYARRRGSAGMNGAGWNAYLYEAHLALYWLYTIEYANTNSQLPFNATSTANGYKQGGLGNGVSSIISWEVLNNYNPVIPCGITNSLGNNTGIIAYSIINSSGNIHQIVSVPSYRGVENPFGHMHKLADGITCRVQSAESGGLIEIYTCDNPANFQDANYANYVKRGNAASATGFITKIIGGEYGMLIPTEVGGSSSTFFCDYLTSASIGSSEVRTRVIVGGSGNNDLAAGLSYASVSSVIATPSANVSSRLCFLQ